MIIIKTEEQITGIKKSCQLAARTLEHLSSFLKPGITTQYLDNLANQFISQHHATAAPLHYRGYPKSICTSVNNVVCHGIPSDQVILKNGDIINIDITTILNGYYGDISTTYPIGQISQSAQDLIDHTRQALSLAIAALEPGKTFSQAIGQVIQPYVEKFGHSVVHDLGGHGIGLSFHEDPFVFHFDTPKNDIPLKPGMTFTIEPMINASSNWHIAVDPIDHWTIRTRDGSLSCQFEHTVLITATGSEVLTKLSP
jgi:methionyl aminopeptidase